VLDVLEELHTIQSSGELSGLAAFRHLEAEVRSLNALSLTYTTYFEQSIGVKEDVLVEGWMYA
jgi:hypothetical protein